MTIALIPFSQLDATQVAQNLADVIERIQEDNPQLDLRRGVFSDLLAYYHALLATQRQMNIDQYLQARSLIDLQTNPDLADEDAVNALLSNYMITRQPGTVSTGQITIVVSDDVTVFIAQGSVWQANGQQFTTQAVFTAKIEAAQINSPNDRLLIETADGNWAFVIDVVAVLPGTQGMITKDTLIVPSTIPQNYVTSFATSDFTGGYNAQTNQDLLNQLDEGPAAKSFTFGRISMEALLRQQTTFARFIHTSVVGLGQPEMLRDKHWIFPVAGGGRVDWYIRTQESAFRQLLTKTATLVAVTNTAGTWQTSLGLDDAPGFYKIANIRLPDAGTAIGGFTVVSDIRDVDLSGTGFIPDIANPVEGAYSRFQTAVIQFIDTTTDAADLAVGTQQTYQLEAICMPLIGDIQDYISSDAVHGYGADCLVKAPVPCFLQLNFTIYKRSGDPDPDLVSIKNSICSLVNNIDFIGQLYASQVQDITYAYLSGSQTVSSVDLFGSLRYPNGSIVYLRDDEKLEIPMDPGNLVSLRTVQFFLSPEDIGISVVTSVPSNL